MKNALMMAGLAFALWACSQDECPTGEPCEKDCNPGESALCVASGICSCVPGGQIPEGGAGGVGFGGNGGVGGGQDNCRPPLPGELIIDEVMIDGVAPDDENEFIELVNASEDAVSVRGITILGSKPDDLKERIAFTGGCLPAGTAVAMFRNAEQWVWSEAPDPLPTFETKGFGFTNSADFQFEVRDAGGVLLNTFAGPGDLDADGVSVTGNPPLSGQPANHAEVAGTDASPGRCANGGTYANQCQDGQMGMGGAGGVGGGVGGMGGVGGGMPQDPLDLVINEVDYDQPGTDEGEFIEVRNNSNEAAELSNYTLILTNGEEGETQREIALMGTLQPFGYFVAGSEAVLAAAPANAVTQDLGGSIQNGSNDGVRLVHANGMTIDGVSWEGASAGATEGTPTPVVDNNDTFSIGRCGDGTDTDDNAADFAENATPTPGAPNDCAMGAGGMGGGMGGMGGGMGGDGGMGGGGMGGDGGGMGGDGGMGGMPPGEPVALLINEVEANATGGNEFVEIFNAGDSDAVLAEYTLVHINGSNGAQLGSVNLGVAGERLAPGAHLVLAQATRLGTLNGVQAAELPFTLQNGHDGLRIDHAGGAVTDSMSYQDPAIPDVTEGSPAPDDTTDDSLCRCPNGSDTNDNSVDFRRSENTPGAPNLCP